jgi:hypothetical protein
MDSADPILLPNRLFRLGAGQRYRERHQFQIHEHYGNPMRISQVKNSIGLIVAIMLYPQIVASQSCCGRVTLPTGSIEQIPLAKGQYEFRAAYEHSLFDRTLLEGDEINDPLNRWNRTQLLTASASYGFSDRLTGSVIVPFKWTRLSLLDDRVVRKTSGIGDIIGIVKLKLTAPISPRRPEIALGLGLKVPTGGHFDGDSFGTMSASQQVGSGAFDFIVSGYYNQSFGWILAYGSTAYRIPTKNDRGYRFGNEFQFAGYALLPAISDYISPFIGFLSRSAARDRYDGSQNDPYGGGAYRDSGGNWIYFTPGFELNPAAGISFDVELWIPIYNYVNGRQISESLTWRVATSISSL